MPVTYAEVEERVIEACCDLETQEILNISATAHKYKALKSRVYRRFTGKSNSRIEAECTNKVLNNAAEQALCLHIKFADDLDIPI
jgi:hypothetical protein